MIAGATAKVDIIKSSIVSAIPTIPPIPSIPPVIVLPVTSPTSLFKDPTDGKLTEMSYIPAGINCLINNAYGNDVAAIPKFGVILDPITNQPTQTFFEYMSLISNGMASAISDKIANIGYELPMASAAAKYQEAAKSIDASLPGSVTAMPDLIASKFPTSLPDNIMGKSFALLTGAKAAITGSTSTITRVFDDHVLDIPAFSELTFYNTNYMSPFYTTMREIPEYNTYVAEKTLSNGGVAPATGLALIGYIGTVYKDGTSSSTGITDIQAAFADAGDTFANNLRELCTRTSTSASVFEQYVNGAGNTLSSLIEDSKSAIKSAVDFLVGGSIVGMLQSADMQIRAVLAGIVDTAQVNYRALAIEKAINEGTIGLPGAQTLQNVATHTTISADPVGYSPLPVSEIRTPTTAPLPAIDYYTSSEISGFKEKLVIEQRDANEKEAAAAIWLKEHLEDWKISVNYTAKKAAAGYTKETPYGTSSDPTVLSSWRTIRDRQLQIVAEYNLGVCKVANDQYKRWETMELEWKNRTLYGKYPYTFIESQGGEFTDAEKTVLLDSTI